MMLPEALMGTINEKARQAGVRLPEENDDLFKSGVLDSFSLIDFVTSVETECGITVPDADVVPANFQTLAAISKYIQSRAG